VITRAHTTHKKHKRTSKHKHTSKHKCTSKHKYTNKHTNKQKTHKHTNNKQTDTNIQTQIYKQTNKHTNNKQTNTQATNKHTNKQTVMLHIIILITAIPVVSDKEAGGFNVSRPKPGPTGLNTREGRAFGAVNNMADCGPSCAAELLPMLKV